MTADTAIRARAGDVPVRRSNPPGNPFGAAPQRTGGDRDHGRAPPERAGVALAADRRLVHRAPAEARDVQFSHFSPNFDRTGFAADINVVYPIVRLNELAATGEIGSVARHHLSFMGAQTDATFTTMLLDSGPAAARVLREDAVDASSSLPFDRSARATSSTTKPTRNIKAPLVPPPSTPHCIRPSTKP